MEQVTFAFDYNSLDVDLSHIEQVLGYGEGDDRTIVDSVVQEILSEKELFNGIKAEYRIFDNPQFVEKDKSLIIGSERFEINKILFRQLRGSSSVAVFLCTAGSKIGIKTRAAMSEGDPVKGYLYDMLGTLVVDAAADKMQEALGKTISERGLKITNRYNPGYCGWGVAEQHKLFRLMGDNYCGIKITESALMQPIKSLSGFIGIGEKVRFNEYTCSLCDLKNCAYREVPATNMH
jgi:hypothetical protein